MREFKVGDVVVSGANGEGEVVNISNDCFYPVQVRWGNQRNIVYYTSSGNYCTGHHYPERNIKHKEKEMNYFPCKIKVHSSNESVAIQEWLFEQGVRWNGGEQQLLFTYKEYLYVTKDKRLIVGGNGACYQSCADPELKFSFVTKTLVESVEIVPNVELVELDGKKYNKADLEKALQHLKPYEE